MAREALLSFQKGEVEGVGEVLWLNCDLRMFLEYFQSSHGVGRRVNLARSSHSGYPSSGLGVSSSVLLLQVLAWSIGRRSYAKVLVVSGSPRKTLQGLECLPVFPRCKLQMYGWLKEW